MVKTANYVCKIANKERIEHTFIINFDKCQFLELSWEMSAKYNESANNYSGIGRYGYFLGILCVGLLSVLLSPEDYETRIMYPRKLLFIEVLSFVAIIILIILRLNNIGAKKRWAIFAVIPIANIFIAFACLVLPKGYWETGELDKTGKILSFIFGSFWIFGTILFFFSYFF